MIPVANKPNVILLYPKTGMDYGSTVAPPHALLSIAAPLLKSGYKVRLLDQRESAITRDTLENLMSSDLICVGVTAMTGTQINNAIHLTDIVRQLTDGAIPIVWGGCHPSVTAEQTLRDDNVDLVVRGEGEVPFLELVRALDSKSVLSDVPGLTYMDGKEVVSTGEAPFLDVDELLSIPWELINVERYIHRDMYLRDKSRVMDIGQTSRGCPFDCGFCSSAAIRHRRWRAMSPEIAVDHIVENVKKFNLDGIWLRDDEFYIKRKRAHAIFEELVKRDINIGFYTSGTRADVFQKATDEELKIMKRAGAHTLKFGAESGSQRILDLMQKGTTVEQTIEANIKCKKYGFNPAFSLMIGYPTETFDEMNQTIDLAFRLKAENPNAQTETICQYTALPGTPDFELAKKYGLEPPESLRGWANWLFDDYDLAGIRSPWYSKKERIYMGNISYISILSDALGNVMTSTKGGFVARILQRPIAKIMTNYYSWRLKNKLYRFAPELAVARKIRERIFYGKGKNPFTIWAKYIGIHLDSHEGRQQFQAKGWSR